MKTDTKYKILKLVKRLINFNEFSPYIEIETKRISKIRNVKIFTKVEVMAIPNNYIIRQMTEEILDKIIEDKLIEIKEIYDLPGQVKIEMEMNVVIPKCYEKLDILTREEI